METDEAAPARASRADSCGDVYGYLLHINRVLWELVASVTLGNAVLRPGTYVQLWSVVIR